MAVTCSCGAISKSGREFTHGFEIYLEKATLLYEASTLGGKAHVSMPLSALTADGKIRKPRLSGGDAFGQEIQAAVDAVTGKKPVPNALSGQAAADALRLCFKEVEAVRRGRAVKVK